MLTNSFKFAVELTALVIFPSVLMSGQSTTRRLKAKTGQLGALLLFMCNINKETYDGFSLVSTI